MNAGRIRATGLALFAAVAATLVFAVPASAATKPYSLVICALGTRPDGLPTENCAPSQPAGVPAQVPPGASGIPMTAAFLNENKVGTGLNLGSANLAAPTGFTVNGASLGGSALLSCTASTPSTTSCLNGNTIELRSLGLVPGAGITVNMTVTPPTTLAACTVASPCSWAVVSKQSNDFSGSPGNNLNVDPSTSTLNTVLAQLQFRTQPHNAVVNTPITGSDYAPDGPVTVEAVDANQSIVRSYQGPVTVQLNPATFEGSGATLGGTPTVNAVNGVASFSDLTVNVAGDGYTLVASAPDLPPPATSTPFNVQQAASICDAKHCPQIDAKSTDFGSAGGIDGAASAAAGSAGAELTETVDFGSQSAMQTINLNNCDNYSAPHFEFVGLTEQRLITSSITTTVLFNITGSAINGQDDCFAATTPFQALNEATNPSSLMPARAATLPDGTTGFAGLLPDCGKKANQVNPTTGPCVQSRTGLSNPLGGGTLTITITSPFDYWHSG
jgi:hypothetical protein